MNKTFNITTKILLALFLGIVIFAILFSFVPSQPAVLEDNSDEYSISSYQISVLHKQDGTLEITETIDVDFHMPKQGIVRALPEVSQVKLFDDQGKAKIDDKYRLKYFDVVANTNMQTFAEGGLFCIRLGTEGQYFFAGQSMQYQISYKVLQDERFLQHDLFYFNLLGSMNDTTIANFAAYMQFEDLQQVPQTKVFVGQIGSTQTLAHNWQNGTLEVFAQNLGVGEAVTLEVHLPSDYLAFTVNHIPDILVLVAIVLGFVLCLWIFHKKSNKSIITPVVQFSVANKYTSSDVGYIIDKRVNTEDIASLIIFWAQKGFVDIIEEGKKTYLARTEKPFSGKVYEKQLFFAIFENLKPHEKISIKEIGVSIAEDVGAAKKGVALENQHLFSASAVTCRGLMIVLVSILLGLSICVVATQAVKDLFFFVGILTGIASGVFLFMVAKVTDKKYALTAKKSWLNTAMCIVFLAGILTLCIVAFDAYSDAFFTIFLAFLLLCFCTILVSKFNVRTNEGCRELGDIIGLKNFIEITEKNRLEMLAKENPQMFYQVLPFAWVLGVYDTWCKKFEGIDVGMPTFYHGQLDVFDVLLIAHILSHAQQSILSSINAANLANVAQQVSSTVGGFNGGGSGGFSGGGMGGGGTSSW